MMARALLIASLLIASLLALNSPLLAQAPVSLAPGQSVTVTAQAAPPAIPDTVWIHDTTPPPPLPKDSTPPPPVVTGTGIPFGAFARWSSWTALKPGPVVLTLSQGYTDASGVITQIAAAGAMKQKLVLSMTGGAHANYLTAGKFDLAKWKATMTRFNTAAIKAAVANGVADGTVVGNSLMDEPENSSWGGVMTKPLLDQMAAYVKAIFPTLPVGPSHGPDGYYLWHPTERYHVVDYVLNQYAARLGDVVTWRNRVFAQAKLDGNPGIGFSMNILGGGVQDRDGTWDCTGPGQGGKYATAPLCQMTATQIRDWGRTLGPAGCMLLMWTYDAAYMAKADNVQAMKDVADSLAKVPAKSCRRG